MSTLAERAYMDDPSVDSTIARIAKKTNRPEAQVRHRLKLQHARTTGQPKPATPSHDTLLSWWGIPNTVRFVSFTPWGRYPEKDWELHWDGGSYLWLGGWKSLAEFGYQRVGECHREDDYTWWVASREEM